MLVRKIKCPSCGANKVNEITTGFIFCDYCSTFMGYDFKNMQDEASSVYDMDYFQKHGSWPPDTQAYMTVLQEIGTAVANENAELYLENIVKMHELEMKLFPKRFAPKLKMSKYRDQMVEFYRHLWKERLEKGYFEEQKQTQQMFAELQANITTETVNYKPVWVYDEKLEAYFDAVFAYSKEMAEKVSSYDCLEYYPEPINNAYTEMVLKQSINGYASYLDEETFNKVLDHLGLKTEYIEIPEVNTTEQNCFGCGAQISVPEGSEKMICEYCGSTNNIQAAGVVCLNCGGNVSPDEARENNKCSFCGAILRIMDFH